MNNKLKFTIRFIITIVIIVSLYLIIGSKEKRSERQRGHDKSLYEANEEIALEVIKNKIHYIYDPKVDICYAIIAPQGRARTITVVDYEKVKDIATVIEREK